MRAAYFPLVFGFWLACSQDASNSGNPPETKRDAGSKDTRNNNSPTLDSATQPVDLAKPGDLARPSDLPIPQKLDGAVPDLAIPKDTQPDLKPAGDLGPPDTAGYIGVPTPNSWLFVVGDPTDPEVGEKALMDHGKQRNQPLAPVESRNYNSSDPASKANINYVWGRKGVIISGSGSSSSIEAAKMFKDVPVPVICLFERTYNMNAQTAWLVPATITTPTNRKATGSLEGSQVEITAQAGPLAAGLTGLVTVLPSAAPMQWGIPQSSEVIVVAKIPAQADAAAIFAYPKGATLDDGSKAPAARVGFFFNTQESDSLSPDGFKLFDALLDWAVSQ